MSATFPLSRRALLASTIASASCPAWGATSLQVYRDPKAPVSVRVKDLISRMNLEEKAAQLRCLWNGKSRLLDEHLAFAPARARQQLPHGIGQLARPSDYQVAGSDVAQFRALADTVKFVNAVQKYHVEETRLGIPVLLHDELAHGLLANQATIFPTPTALASSFDPDLVEDVFTVAAREARARGTTIALTPVIDLLRDPRYGRSEEFFGEDPFLVGRMGTAAVHGLQGRSRPLQNDRVFATLKHFVHGSPTGGLNIGPADTNARMMREAFLVPFSAVIKNADPAIVMASYNEVEGIPSHANAHLLQDTGRGMLGFRGMYSSDYDGIANLASQHHIAANNDEAAILALRAGVQSDLPEGQSFANLPQLVRAGRISEKIVDEAVSQILSLKFEAGLFERPYVDPRRLDRETMAPAHTRLARTAAEKAITLLTNDGILPLPPQRKMTLAVIGPNASEALYGGYSGENDKGVSILQGLRSNKPSGVQIVQADGVWITAPDDNGRHLSYSKSQPVSLADNLARISHAVEVAKSADVILLVLGDSPAVTREAVAWDIPGDRSTLGLWGQQDELFEAMLALGKPIVTLLINGRPLATPRLAEKANALLEGWYLGQEGGNAFADVLFGHVEPGGRLPVSLPYSVGELPVFYNRHPSSDTNHYIERVGKPLFPFGHGLGYTTFDIGAPRLSRASIGRYEDFEVEVEVANTGLRPGDEVIQLYIRDDVSSVPRPVLELRAFQRVRLDAGTRRIVTFKLPPDALAFWDIHMEWIVEPGTFTIYAGASSARLKSTALTVA